MSFQAFVLFDFFYLKLKISNNCFYCQSILSVEDLCKQ